MKTIDIIRNRLIDKILSIQNEKLLEGIEKIFNATQKDEKVVLLYPEQEEMLMMSEDDIKNENFVSEADLDKMDSEWLY